MRFLMIMVGMLFFSISPFFAQQTVTLGDAIRIAQSNSFDAQLARFSFLSSFFYVTLTSVPLLPFRHIAPFCLPA